jgi:hypothetical protein
VIAAHAIKNAAGLPNMRAGDRDGSRAALQRRKQLLQRANDVRRLRDERDKRRDHRNGDQQGLHFLSGLARQRRHGTLLGRDRWRAEKVNGSSDSSARVTKACLPAPEQSLNLIFIKNNSLTSDKKREAPPAGGVKMYLN